MIEIPNVLTAIKKGVADNKHLDDKSKQIVYHILRKVWKDVQVKEAMERAEEEAVERQYRQDSGSDSEAIDFLQGMMGMKK